ncbi:MAG: hypothetical protein FJ266_02885 [Planctomycetes bacterium]|nr:hypothetical protein [Planctomycetota bacterium]
MKHTTEISKATRAIGIMLLFLTALIVSTKASLADEPTDDNQQKKTVKYSKFFDEKKQWCDALVISCSDFRFTSATQEFINNRLGLKNDYDYISIPGSIRNLLDKKTRYLVFQKFGVSVRLHHVKRIIILGHQDCTTGYGGSGNFADTAVEYKTICKDLKKARRLMRFKFSHLKVFLYYATVTSHGQERIFNYRQIL